jgi:hypothetical protein
MKHCFGARLTKKVIVILNREDVTRVAWLDIRCLCNSLNGQTFIHIQIESTVRIDMQPNQR